MEFNIVKFPDENNDVALVPTKWIVRGQCYWPPPPSDVTKLAKKITDPDIKKWKPCRAVINGKSFGNYIFSCITVLPNNKFHPAYVCTYICRTGIPFL